MKGIGVKFTPARGKHLLMPFKRVWAYDYWDPWLVQTVLIDAASNFPPTPSTCPSLPPTPYNMPSVILQWF